MFIFQKVTKTVPVYKKKLVFYPTKTFDILCHLCFYRAQLVVMEMMANQDPQDLQDRQAHQEM